LILQIDTKNPTSAESLAATAQHLTERIDKAKSQGAYVGAAEAERPARREGDSTGQRPEALRHFQAG
jgi:hypothetical protein